MLDKKTMLKYNILITILVQLIFIHSQENLVADSSFEIYTKCPKDISEVSKFPLKYWWLPTPGSSDYFNECCFSNKVGIPKNKFGYQSAHTGKGYVGIGSNKVGHEYVQTKLRYPLKKDSTYQIEFYVSLSDNSYLISKTIGFYLTKLKIDENLAKLNNYGGVFNYYIEDTVEWIRLSFNYISQGDEQYLTIGDFENDKSFKKTGKKKQWYEKGWAYYYIDDVSVIQIKEDKNHLSFSSQSNNQEKGTSDSINSKFSTGQKIILPSLTFKVNEWDLVKINNSILDSLSIFLNNNPNLKITIDGFTDNIGTEESNMILSEKRAESVKEYLVNMGVIENRISFKGHGSQTPIKTNETEDGRAKNRRVEIVILEQ